MSIILQILQYYVKSSRTWSHHLRLPDRLWHDWSHRTHNLIHPRRSDDKRTLVKDHWRNHVEIWWDASIIVPFPRWHQWEGRQDIKLVLFRVNHVARCDTQKIGDFSAQKTLSSSNQVLADEHAQTFVLLKTVECRRWNATTSTSRRYLIDFSVNLVI